MFTILPLLCFVLVFLVFYMKSNSCWRSSFLSAYVVWGLLLTMITEFLNIFNCITFSWFLGLWGLTSFISAYICLLIIKKEKLIIRFERSNIPHFEILCLFGVTFIVISVGLIALVAPPNNWDSMTYHMGRVVHWVQNQNISFYPTNILRQLHQNPWAEFTIMHFQILSGGDRFANFIQWFSMIGAIIGVSLITKELGANFRGQIFAAVVSATIPMGILQASSTQNDYVVSLWLVCFVYYIVLSIVKERTSLTQSLGAGSSLGLAILTKGTAYIFAFPFLVWFVLSREKILRRETWKPFLIIAFASLTINLGHYSRNWDLYGSPLGPGQESPSGEYKYVNNVFAVPSVISNISRNVGLHIGTPFRRFNAVTERGIHLLHTLLGVDTNDPRTTWTGTEFHIRPLSNHEDTAGNPAHFVLIVVSVAVFLISKQLRESRNLGKYSIAVTVAFLLFTLCIKWTPWHSRLHLPLFIFWSPFIAIVLSRFPNHKITNSIAVVLILSALPWVLNNRSRPLIAHSNIFNTSRIDQYFSNRPELKGPYIGATNFLKSQKCPCIGLSLGPDDWEYPFWVLLRKNEDQVVRIEHVDIQNISAAKSNLMLFESFSPCAIISLESGESTEIIYKENVYAKGWSLDPVNVFVSQ
jgi:hypothetical protein